MLGIDIQPEWQKVRVSLMRRFGCVPIGGRECMGCINPENSKEAVYLSHAMMDTWAQDAVEHKNGATEMMPPTRRIEFRFIPIQSKPGRQLESTASTTQSTSQIPINQPDSPPPYPLPPFEDYLKFANISPKDQSTRDILVKCDIIDFESFLSNSMDVPTLERLGFAYGTAVRLHDRAPLYRTDLKNRKNDI
ncbi:uncharacterized protein MELLADRAFT_92458 [Melampsora larici-populina 98AG31]|uniref:Uncharacterized protein n=1 Tax=Melampsora larici-populina (strain 98AG31 / pathotype 3-4-7) TaxID=747676 RepID=F4R9R4_MELLP|nr:uncharacterized protein MELLADRAFT_92458 [Melampsora larici-populina 98AG31]EGG11104.1 hypothetical protein MELLADRAFT_92458 [Melampsora larici-populina 98AG31]